jgi:hypothetical protein
MASEGRDRNFDKALARHLRSAAASNEGANLSAGADSPGSACPDSEILAAYHERSLLPEEMNSLKTHIIGCANCQTVLAQLEATDGIPLQAATRDEVPAAKDFAPAIAARSFEFSPEPAAPVDIRHTGAALPAKSRRAQLLRGARWEWLAPAGAIAAGLLLWIAWHENRFVSAPKSADIEIAASQPAPARTPPLDLEPPAPRASSSRPSLPSPLEERTRSNPRAESPALKQRQTAEFGGPVAPTKRGADKESVARKDAASATAEDLLREAKPEALDAKNIPSTSREIVQLETAAPVVQNQNQSNNAAPISPGPSALGQALDTKKMKVAPQAPKQQAAYSTATSVEVVAEPNPRLVPAPGSNVVWRAGRAGLLEFSRDAGSSWSRQSSGVLVDLLTGSALSDQVCWIVGRGAILLTTDGGAHWKIVNSPVSEDLGGIRATDALHATVWNAKGTKSFETSDGGLTWQRIANR